MKIVFFPELLRSVRKRKNFSIAQMADVLGVSVATYSARERGERAGWTEPEMLHKLCSVLEIDMEELKMSIEFFDELRTLHKDFNRALLKNYNYGRIMFENGFGAEWVLRMALRDKAL